MSNQSLTPLMTASSPGVGRASGFKLASRGRLDAANIESALALDDPVAATIGEHWDVLSDQTKPEVLAAIVAGMPALHALRELSSAELMAAVEAERERRAAEENDEEPPGLLDEEWELLSHPTT